MKKDHNGGALRLSGNLDARLLEVHLRPVAFVLIKDGVLSRRCCRLQIVDGVNADHFRRNISDCFSREKKPSKDRPQFEQLFSAIFRFVSHASVILGKILKFKK